MLELGLSARHQDMSHGHLRGWSKHLSLSVRVLMKINSDASCANVCSVKSIVMVTSGQLFCQECRGCSIILNLKSSRRSHQNDWGYHTVVMSGFSLQFASYIFTWKLSAFVNFTSLYYFVHSSSKMTEWEKNLIHTTFLTCSNISVIWANLFFWDIGSIPWFMKQKR